MKFSTVLFGVVLVVMTAVMTNHVVSQEKSAQQKDPKAEMEAYMKLAETNQYHAYLKPMVGSWTASCKAWMEPEAAPTESKASCENRLVLGGRFLFTEYKGEMMGMTFDGMSILGYDNQKQKYTSVWVDTMGTGLFNQQGSIDAAGKVLTMVGEYDDPMGSGKIKLRSVTKIIDDNKHTFEMYETRADGKERKHLEVVYTRNISR